MAETERIFQSYEGFTVEMMPKSHRYAILHPIDLEDRIKGELPERKPVVSVTTAIGILSKPQLLGWYGRTDSEAILTLEREDELRGLSVGEAHDFMRSRGLGAEAKRDEGAARGTAVHDALQAYCETGLVPLLGAFDEAVRGYASALCSWLIDAEPEPVLVEQIVGSPTHGFAGRLDLIANIGGVRACVDLKTSRNAGNYPESHAQLAGYSLALAECGIEPVEMGLIVEVAENGSYRVVEGLGTAEDFLSILACYRTVGGLRSRLRAAEKARVAA